MSAIVTSPVSSLANNLATNLSTTSNRAPRRADASLVGQLNAEWGSQCQDPATAAAVKDWAGRHRALAGCVSLPDIERAVAAGSRQRADDILLALLRIAQGGQPLAARTVFQLMIGKAIRIAGSQAGRDLPANLEHIAVTGLWMVVATYPIQRRPVKVAANIALETLGHVVRELTYQRHELPANPHDLQPAAEPAEPDDQPADLEILGLLAWAVHGGIVTSEDATLIVDIYAPAPGRPGGQEAAVQHGISWPTARQRASRAIRKIAQAVRADDSGYSAEVLAA